MKKKTKIHSREYWEHKRKSMWALVMLNLCFQITLSIVSFLMRDQYPWIRTTSSILIGLATVAVTGYILRYIWLSHREKKESERQLEEIESQLKELFRKKPEDTFIAQYDYAKQFEPDAIEDEK